MIYMRSVDHSRVDFKFPDRAVAAIRIVNTHIVESLIPKFYTITAEEMPWATVVVAAAAVLLSLSGQHSTSVLLTRVKPRVSERYYYY